MMQSRFKWMFRPGALALAMVTGTAALLNAAASHAQQAAASDERWYQIEVTVFAHNNAMFEQEIWPMEALSEVLPRATRPLDSMMDVLDLPDWSVLFPVSVTSDENLPEERVELAAPLQQSDFRLPDPERDAFLALPASAQGFTDTNRALIASGSYRVLYHNAWRQPMRSASQSVPVWIEGGAEYVVGNTPRHELEGTLVLRFNPGRDRVVLDAKLWLSEFTTLAPALGQAIQLPELPPALLPPATDNAANTHETNTDNTNNTLNSAPSLEWHVNRVIPVLSTREMRSNEFHYVDHPAVGIVVYVFPYDVPPPPMIEPGVF